MSKKDYVAIAAVFKGLREKFSQSFDARLALRYAANEIADYMQREAPETFNRTRFLNAADVGPDSDKEDQQ